MELLVLSNITGVITQGCGDNRPEWIETYKVMYSNDGLDWQHVTKKGTPDPMVGLAYTLWNSCLFNPVSLTNCIS